MCSINMCMLRLLPLKRGGKVYRNGSALVVRWAPLKVPALVTGGRSSQWLLQHVLGFHHARLAPSRNLCGWLATCYTCSYAWHRRELTELSSILMFLQLNVSRPLEGGPVFNSSIFFFTIKATSTYYEACEHSTSLR